ncbi:MAG TPA: quinolinate synthase NadA [Candidatus Megaira endosymbiont of Hartmannula sinica]|nr:quinolinate synthase NadA [Candidatus Megaera endosymbiont of Hartmannula sinica]
MILENSKVNDNNELVKKIIKLKKEKNAVILAHYYQTPEIQDLADYIGDSFYLSQKAEEENSDVIVFCGVKFMAEAAHILNPTKKVIIPDMNAGCSLEHSCPPNEFALFKQQYPNHIVISYINCSAEIKAMSDIIVTSSNAEKVIKSIPQDKKIIFTPDKHLGRYIINKTGREMVLWNGSCIVHENFSEKDLMQKKAEYPYALVIAHPECPENLLNYSDYIGSTSKLLKFVETNNDKDFIILTERGIIHQMKKISPKSKFITINDIKNLNDTEDNKNNSEIDYSCKHCSQCPFMKKNTLEKLYKALDTLKPIITVKQDIAILARKSLNRMLEYK